MFCALVEASAGEVVLVDIDYDVNVGEAGDGEVRGE